MLVHLLEMGYKAASDQQQGELNKSLGLATWKTSTKITIVEDICSLRVQLLGSKEKSVTADSVDSDLQIRGGVLYCS